MGNNDYRLQLAADLSQVEKGLASLTNQLSGVVGGLNETDAALKKTGQASGEAGNGTQRFATSLNSTRYALYDMSRGLLVTGAAFLAFGLAPTKVAIDFQREFANVQRTVEGAGQGIKNELKELSTQIPITFKDLTEIATLGGQLGMGKESITQFTETVAKLTATAAISADVAGTALGRFEGFGLVTSKEFTNLASAILKVGVNSVATDQQIITIATRIAGVGKSAGLNAATLVGFAGALASVGIQAYGASGSTIRLIQKMQAATISGGEKLETFAKVAGVSSDQFKKAFGTEKFNPIFQSFIKNLGNLAVTGKDVNLVLKELSLSGAIDSRTFTQLAAAPGVTADAFKNAISGFKEATELNLQYGNISDTVAAKITKLGNAILNLMDTVGSQTTGPLGAFLSLLIDAANGLSDFLSTPLGGGLAVVAVGFSAIVGTLLVLGSVVARAAGGIIAMTTALGGLSAASATSTGLMATLNAQLAASGPLGAKAAAGLSLVSKAMKGLAIFGAITAVVAGVAALGAGISEWTGATKSVDAFTKSLDKAGDSYKKTINDVFNSAKKAGTIGTFGDTDLKIKPPTFSSGDFKWITDIWNNTGTQGSSEAFISNISKLDEALGKLAGNNAGKAASQYKYLSDKMKEAGYSSKEIAEALPNSTAALAEHSKEVEKAKDATSQLADVTQSTTGFMEALQQETGMDAKGIQKWIENYQKGVASLSDFNTVVKQVQESLNANAQAQAEAAGSGAKAKDFYDGQSVTLQQYTDQLNANNSAQQAWADGLVELSIKAGPEAAAPFIQAGYSAVGLSILQQLNNATPEQAAAYIAAQQKAAALASEATAAAILSSGYLVEGSLSQVSAGASAAFRDGLARGIPVEKLMNDLNLRFSSQPARVQADTSAAQGQINSLIYANDGRAITLRINTVGGNVAGFANSGGQRVPFATGGHVSGPGTGTSDSIPANLSNGEYVIKASRVRQLGVPYLDSLNGGRSSTPGRYAQGGPVQGGGVGVGVVELGPTSLGVLRQAVRQELSVQLGSETIARSSNAGNARMNSRGAR